MQCCSFGSIVYHLPFLVCHFSARFELVGCSPAFFINGQSAEDGPAGYISRMRGHSGRAMKLFKLGFSVRNIKIHLLCGFVSSRKKTPDSRVGMSPLEVCSVYTWYWSQHRARLLVCGAAYNAGRRGLISRALKLLSYAWSEYPAIGGTSFLWLAAEACPGGAECAR